MCALADESNQVNNNSSSNRNGWGSRNDNNPSNNQAAILNAWGGRFRSNNDQDPDRNGQHASNRSNASSAQIRNNNDQDMSASVSQKKRKKSAPSVRTKACKKDVDSHVKCCLKYIQQFLKKPLVHYRKHIVAYCFDPRVKVARPPHVELANFIDSHIPEVHNHTNYSIYIAQTMDNSIHSLHFGGTVHRNFRPGKRAKWINSIYSKQQHKVNDLMPLSARPVGNNQRYVDYSSYSPRDNVPQVINARNGDESFASMSISSYMNEANDFVLIDTNDQMKEQENENKSNAIEQRTHQSNEASEHHRDGDRFAAFIESSELMAERTMDQYDSEDDISVFSSNSFVELQSDWNLQEANEKNSTIYDELEQYSLKEVKALHEKKIECNVKFVPEPLNIESYGLITSGQQVSQYWFQLLEDRILIKNGIVDIHNLLKYKFVKNNEHVFGLKFRYRMMKAAQDLYIFTRFAAVYEDLSPCEEYNYKKLSYKFTLPPKVPLKERIDVVRDHSNLKFTEDHYRYIANMIVNNPIYDLGFQFEALKVLEPSVTGGITDELKCCYCPFGYDSFALREKAGLGSLLPQDKETIVYDADRRYEYTCGCKGPMTPKELYAHCQEVMKRGFNRGYHSPFHNMFLLFLEFLYINELPNEDFTGDYERYGKKHKSVLKFKYNSDVSEGEDEV